MVKLNRSQVQVFGLSFLDVLTCALGALIILFLIIPKYPPTPEQQQKLVQKLQAIIHSLKSENEDLAKTLSVKTVTKKPTPSPAPTLFGLPLKANNAVFVIDVSGSMGWQINNLYKTIESLLLSCELKKFRFIYFDEYIYSTGHYWRHGWLNGSIGNKQMALKEAKDFLPQLIADEPGATNSGDAIYEAISTGEADCVYFITDGYPTAGETNVNRILMRTKRINKGKAIINSVMVGLPGTTLSYGGNVVFDSKANPKQLYDFLHTLAEENGGVYIGR
tara:strand:- start:366 stop:1196 length:831 start_codon:yes stop_codon:yes gene_type:complete